MQNSYEEALLFSIRSLSKKNQLSEELYKKLLKRGYSPEVIERVLTFLKEQHYLNDPAWMENLILAERRKARGPQAIVQKLILKGVSADEAHQRLGDLYTSEDQEVAIKQLLNTKYRNTDWENPKERQKTIQALLRKGFSWEHIQRVVF